MGAWDNINLQTGIQAKYFFIIAVVSIVQIAFIEGSRIWLYNSVPTRFDYM